MPLPAMEELHSHDLHAGVPHHCWYLATYRWFDVVLQAGHSYRRPYARRSTGRENDHLRAFALPAALRVPAATDFQRIPLCRARCALQRGGPHRLAASPPTRGAAVLPWSGGG